jgi:hypothetical protein
MQIIYPLQCSPELAFETLSDFKKFGALHPYMTNVEAVDDAYLVNETVPMFGFVPIKNEYRVYVEAKPLEQKVYYRSPIKKSVSLEIVWQVKDQKLMETITIHANPLVRFILGIVMKRTHRQIVDAMNGHWHK